MSEFMRVIAEEFLKRVEKGDVEGARAKIKEGASPNTIGLAGWPALKSAADSTNHEMMRMLLEEGAFCDPPECGGLTALRVCLNNKDLKGARLLLEHGADVNKIYFGESIIVSMSKEEYSEAVKLLVEFGASLETEDHRVTPLMWAAVKDNKDIALFLLSNGAAINSEDIHGRTALDFAIERSHSEMEGLLRAWRERKDIAPASEGRNIERRRI